MIASKQVEHGYKGQQCAYPAGRPSCRLCNAPLSQVFLDLGKAPPSNAFLTHSQQFLPEVFYPLCTYVCPQCLLVQIPEVITRSEIFKQDYLYFSSFSESWLEHCRQYVENISKRFQLGVGHQVVEIASNDGYLLQYFLEKNIPVLGIEPSQGVAQVAINKGIPTRIEFFGTETATALVKEGYSADLLIGNNVLAHVPDLHDFLAGVKIALKPQGVLTMEFPHLEKLLLLNQFDTIYHEHYSYFSLLSAEKAFAKHGLTIFDVEEISTHGGSLRVYVKHQDDLTKEVLSRVVELKERESLAGLAKIETYQAFARRVEAHKRKLLEFLFDLKNQGKSIAAYGAAAKGNTLLNYCGIRSDIIDYVVDRNTYKQGHIMPGSNISIFPPEKISETKPDYVLILPWNLRQEIVSQMKFIRDWGGKFVVLIPDVEVFS